MSGPEREPDFGLLPEDPQAFFGLERGFLARELKRRYTRLIKRYKPERDPHAFQQIRAAYEQLQTQLTRDKQSSSDASTADALAPTPRGRSDLSPPRHEDGNDPDLAGDEGDDDESDDGSGSDDDSDDDDSDEAVWDGRALGEALLARIRSEGPTLAYELLLSKQPKEPDDYLHLAVLSDIVPGPAAGPGQDYLGWLLTGLRNHPDDEGLEASLAALCGDGLPPDELGPGLERIARAITPGRFYALTGPLWLTQLRHVPFAEFKALLARCDEISRGRGLSDPGAPPRARLLVRLLLGALWRADEGWSRDTMAFLSRNHTLLPSEVAGDLDFVEQLRDYLVARSGEVTQSAAWEHIDRILRAYAELTEVPFDQVLFRELALLRAQGLELIDACESGAETADLAVSLLESIAAEAEARRLRSAPDLRLSLLEGSLRRLEWGYANDSRWGILRAIPRSAPYLAWIGYLPSAGLVGLSLLPSVQAGATPLRVAAAVLWLGFFAANWLLGLGAKVRQRALHLTGFLMDRLRERIYRVRLRPGLAELLGRTRGSPCGLADALEALAQRTPWTWNCEWLAGLLRRDVGLTLYSLTRRFERP